MTLWPSLMFLSHLHYIAVEHLKGVFGYMLGFHSKYLTISVSHVEIQDFSFDPLPSRSLV